MANPKTGRPSRLVNLQNSPTSKRAITATNATSSLFLKLPAELRQRIYNYALGGNTLHVSSPTNAGRSSGPDPVVICSCPQDYEDDDCHSHMRHEPSSFKYATIGTSFLRYTCLGSHEQCYQEASAQGKLSVQLLQTCRQIYHEAVLVPFSANTFAVFSDYPSSGSPTALVKFLNRLVPSQIKAISRLVLQPFRMDVCTWNQLKRLTGLDTLRFVLLAGHPIRDRDPQWWASHWERGFAKAKLENLAELPRLQNVRIEIRTFPLVQWNLEEGSDQVPEPIKLWVASAESRMMGMVNSQSDQ